MYACTSKSGRKSSCPPLPALALYLALAAGPAYAAEPVVIDWQPFSVDHDNSEGSPVDVSFVLGDAPAGADGFVTVENGHFVDGDGDRLRLWGVNLTGWTRGGTMLPPKDQAEKWAKIMARNGINAVRFHFLDMPTRSDAEQDEKEEQRLEAADQGYRFRVPPVGIIDGSKDTTTDFDAEQMDRLDYFIFQLKQAGIYSNLNLNVGRTYKAGDNVPDSDAVRLWKGFTYLGERLIELQKDYARRLLTHHNPYTGTKYSDEPAIVTVEIVNENSIYEFWMRNWLRGELTADNPAFQLDLTPFYAGQLDDMYQAWLAEHRKPRQIAAMREEAGVPDGAPVPRLTKAEFSVASDLRFHAEADFLESVEKAFFFDMYGYIKDELGVQSLVIGNADHTYWIPNQPMMRANAELDFVDAHVYWQHPAIWGRRNLPMVNDPLDSTIVKLSRSPFSDHAFTVSEVNHPNPSEYSAEMIPILAAYAGLQDWDGIYFYTFEPKTGDGWQDYVADEFDITLDPVKMTQMKAGSLLFARGDVEPARDTVVRDYSRAAVNESMRLPEAERPFFTPGFPRATPLVHGTRIGTLDGEITREFAPVPGPPYRSDTGELAWYVEPDTATNERHGLVTIDTPRTQALVGFVSANADKTTTHLAAELDNEFAAITLSSLDDSPIQRAPRLLLTAAARWQNTGSEWNERHTLWEFWGKGPTLIEPVTGWLMLRELDGAVAVRITPLDGASQPIGEPRAGRRMEVGWEVELGTEPTVQYLVEVHRSGTVP
ncbi:MAG TPA: hypothetical protein VFY03_04605 [Woeseiaceae bacterium]|nr:hypothetical protein [Woeseiaceae bacterium]